MYNKNINMNNEFLKMQKIAGLITESEYKEKMNEEVSDDVKQYLTDEFEEYLEGGDTFEEEPGETHVFVMEEDDEQYYNDFRFNRAINQLQNSPIILDYNKDIVGDYGKVTARADIKNIYISFTVPEDEY
jgi:hypothetical protein